MLQDKSPTLQFGKAFQIKKHIPFKINITDADPDTITNLQLCKKK